MVQNKRVNGHDSLQTRRRRVLQAASRAFRKRGFHATGMRDIAAALGMTVGNLYYYFENKLEVLAFCQEETASRLLELASWARAQGLGADGELYLLIVGQAVCLNEGTPGSLAHMEVEALDPPWRHRILELRDRFEAAIRETVQRGLDQAIFREVDPKVAAFAILGAVNWTVKWFRPDGGRSARSIGEDFAEQLVRGLLRPGVELAVPPMAVPSFTGIPAAHS